MSKPLEVYLTTLKIYSHCLSTVQLPLPLGCESVFLPTATVIISAAILTMTSKILILKLFIPEKTDSGNYWNSLFSHGDKVFGHIAWHHINHSLTAVFHTELVLMSKPTHFGIPWAFLEWWFHNWSYHFWLEENFISAYEREEWIFNHISLFCLNDIK